ncbi:MAG: MOSC domain-containing protein [Gemmatimonadales bacterium]
MSELRLSAINVYPIKSAAGLPQSAWEVDSFGLRHDRRWMLVDEAGDFLSQRTHPRLALIRPELRSAALVLRASGRADLELPFAAPAGPEVVVTVWGGETRGESVAEDADRWIAELVGVACRLVHMPEHVVRPVGADYAFDGERTSFTDGFPFLLISEASLADLNARLATPVPMNRFRPNLVVAGSEPFAEDGWRRIRIGPVAFRVAKRCPRCVTTTVDQATGAPQGPEPLRTLATFRRNGEGQVDFGQNLLHAGTGRLEVGMPVQILD